LCARPALQPGAPVPFGWAAEPRGRVVGGRAPGKAGEKLIY
jgi:hypothetical protein